eukprot:343444-Pyramimonas_sp.AAC.1
MAGTLGMVPRSARSPRMRSAARATGESAACASVSNCAHPVSQSVSQSVNPPRAPASPTALCSPITPLCLPWGCYPSPPLAAMAARPLSIYKRGMEWVLGLPAWC